MAGSRATDDWETATWEGNRRAQLRAALERSPRERLETLEELAEISRHLARLREEGRLHGRRWIERPTLTPLLGGASGRRGDSCDSPAATRTRSRGPACRRSGSGIASRPGPRSSWC
jgi:hypothetical protein